MKAQWQAEKAKITAVQDLKEKLEAAHRDAERAEREADLQRAAELRYGEIPELERELAEAEARSDANDGFLKEEVTRRGRRRGRRALDAASPSAGCSRARSRSSSTWRSACTSASSARTRPSRPSPTRCAARAPGCQDPDRPIGTFLFLGPTGVGKTELARALAEFMFDTQEAMVRIDMSEYMEKHSVSRLVGAPPGYVGYEEGGQLTEAVRRRPYSRRAARRGREGPPRRLQRAAAGHGRRPPDRRPGPHGELQERRADHDLEHPGRAARARSCTSAPSSSTASTTSSSSTSLDRSQIGEIVALQTRRVIDRLAERGIAIELTPEARELLGDLGYDPVYGARPLKRVIQKRLVDRLALAMLQGEFAEGDTVRVDAADGELVLVKAPRGRRRRGVSPASTRCGGSFARRRLSQNAARDGGAAMVIVVRVVRPCCGVSRLGFGGLTCCGARSSCSSRMMVGGRVGQAVAVAARCWRSLSMLAARCMNAHSLLAASEAAAAEAAHAAVVFAVGEDRFDRCGSAGRRRRRLRGCVAGVPSPRSGVASAGGGPVVWPSSRAARRCLWSFMVAIRRSGPGAVALASLQ